MCRIGFRLRGGLWEGAQDVFGVVAVEAVEVEVERVEPGAQVAAAEFHLVVDLMPSVR